MRYRNAVCIVVCLLLMPLRLVSQTDRLGKDIRYGISLRGTSGGGDNAPFWFTNNQYGLGPIDNHSLLFRSYVKREVETDSLRHWRIGYGADMAVGKGIQSTFAVQQLFLEVQWKNLRLSLGQKQRPSEFKNEELSTGGMTLGINARPIPQVRLEIPDFLIVPGTKGLFAVKAHIAYGKYTDSRWQREWCEESASPYTRGSLFHSKSLFMKIGNEKRFPLTLKWGLEMACQFGGKGYNLKNYNDEKLVQGVSLGRNIVDSFFPGGEDVNDDSFSNAAGNHLGSWHFRLDWTAKNWSVGGYMDHFFEDHSQMFVQYGLWKDMLLGIEMNLPENPYLSCVVYEHVGTMNQSGPIYHDATEENPLQISANDAYYNHHVYGSWQHGGFVMGNPVILSPLYNEYMGMKDGYMWMGGLLNSCFNRADAHHVGLKGNPSPRLSWRVLYTYEKNLGSYDYPVKDPLEGHFLLLEATYRLKKTRGLGVTASYGHNHGSLLGNANGATLTVAWDGWIRRND